MSNPTQSTSNPNLSLFLKLIRKVPSLPPGKTARNIHTCPEYLPECACRLPVKMNFDKFIIFFSPRNKNATSSPVRNAGERF